MSGDFLFDGKYDGLFLDNGMFDLNNPIVRFVGKYRDVYPNDDMWGTLVCIDKLLAGIYEEERGEQCDFKESVGRTGRSSG
ncbi:MAG: hypothetical protein ACXABD_16770 [Candidatus Thorarchaeota archaeon]